MSYVKPEEAMDGEAAHLLWQQLNTGIQELLGQAKTELIIAAQPPYAEQSRTESDGKDFLRRQIELPVNTSAMS